MKRIEEIIKSLDKSKKHYAIFDCDDTIIQGDVENLTMRYQLETKTYNIDEGFLKNKLKKFTDFKEEIENVRLDESFLDLLSKIYVRYKEDISIYLLYGYTKEQVYDITRKALKYYKNEFSQRKQIKELFDLLMENNIEIYICSASVKYQVFVVSDMYNLKRENVLAIELKENEQGKLISKEIGIITRGQGKIEAIKSLNYGYDPILIAGDSDGDYPMMKYFKIKHAMIINPKEGTKISDLVDNNIYVRYIM